MRDNKDLALPAKNKAADSNPREMLKKVLEEERLRKEKEDKWAEIYEKYDGTY